MRARRPARMFGLVGAGVVLAGAVAVPAAAHVYKPTTTADHAVNGCSQNDCTVREAISAANASPDPDVVKLRAGKTYKVTLDPGNVEDANAGGDLDVTSGPMTIKAKGKGYAVLDAKHGNRVLDISPSHLVAATLKGIWVRNGSTSGDGGGIRAGFNGTADLSLVRSRVSDSKAAGGGGGIYIQNAMSSNSTLKLVKSTISDNKSTNSGGGLALIDMDVATIDSSTISGNRAGDTSSESGGGGIFAINNATTVNMTNSTVTENKSSGGGGGIDVFSATGSLEADTIARNVADFNGDASGVGGGLQVSNSTATVGDTVFALNESGAANHGFDDCASSNTTVTPQGKSLFSITPTGCSAFAVPPNIVQANPHLGNLAGNGGPTKTVELLKGSKAIDHAGSGAPARDQRGVKRDAKPDIGAFERG